MSPRVAFDGVVQPDPVADVAVLTKLLAGITADGSFDERYSGGKSAFATTVAAAGDTTLVTPASGSRLRIVWISAIPNPDNATANRVRFKFGTGNPFYETYALAHWEIFDGAVDQSLVLNCQTADPVSVTVHYRELS